MDAGYEIYEYSRKGALADLREALDSGIRADEYQAYDGSTALVMAARCGHPHIVRELLDRGANLGVHTDDGSSVLSHAVSGGDCDVVSMVLGEGAVVDEANEDGVTPLMLAAHYGWCDILEKLCDGGADLTLSANGWGTALDGAEGDAAAYLEKRGATRSRGGADQPLASGAERFMYGCFESGAEHGSAPPARPVVGQSVRLARAKPGTLKLGEVGIVLDDDGASCVPLKVQAQAGHDYYDPSDLVVCDPAVELPPDSDRATAEGTERFLASRLHGGLSASTLGSTGLRASPVGFGCHRIDETHKAALALAISLGCNLVDVAPNYTDGVAEKVVGEVLAELMQDHRVRRDEVIVVTKVGNVLGQQLRHADGVPGMTQVQAELKHCISPAWIEQEINRSLERLQLKCIDCVLLHCPEFETRGPGVDMDEVYARLHTAFRHLETEVARGRIASYGVSAAFFPLRPTEAEHLNLESLIQQLPEDHHFRILQFPLNFAEAQNLTVAHVPRNSDGAAVDRERISSVGTLFELARRHGLATLTNRPLDGIYKEAHGVLRFSSLDCDVRSFSELQLDNCDVLETRLTSICSLDQPPFRAGEGAAGQLASKTVKVLSSLEGVDVVLLGMRRPEYVLGTLSLALNTPRVPAETALKAVTSVKNTIEMWFATAIHEADHGTSKHWRLPVDQKGIAVEVGGA